MDQIIRLAARHCLLAVCAFPMFISPVYALNFHAAPLEPERRIYDNADIFSDAEEIELNAALSERSADSRTHFVILTANGNTIEGLEGFSREFYETNIMGKGGVSNCAMLTIDMSIRQVAIDGYGELRQMASDSEWSVIRERLTPELTNGDYAAAARIFLEDSYPLVDSKYELYYTDTPTVDPSERLYDFAGVLSDEQYNELADRIKQISEKRGADFIIAIIEEPVGEEYSTVDYLERFAGSFYKRNFSEAAEYAGAYLLVISPQTQTAGASPFGTFIVENYDLYLTNSGVTDKLEYSVYSACDYFLYEQEEVWILEHMEIPAADPSKLIFDNSDLFTAGEEEDLWVQLREKADRHKVDLYILTTDYWSDDTVYRFQSDFISKNLYATENFLLLTIGGLPAIEGEAREVYMNEMGRRAWNKIDYYISDEIESAVSSVIDESGDYHAACLRYINLSSKYLSSIIPDIEMIRYLRGNLGLSSVAGLGVSALILLVIWITHGFRMKKELSARNYFKDNSLRLNYSADIFLSTHTSRTKIERESSSGGGGSSGSSDGGTSSRSQGGF